MLPTQENHAPRAASEWQWWTIPVELAFSSEKTLGRESALHALEGILAQSNTLLEDLGEIRAVNLSETAFCLLSYRVFAGQDFLALGSEIISSLQEAWPRDVGASTPNTHSWPVRHLNTSIHYLYRDANNFKSGAEFVLAGEVDLGDLQIIKSALAEGGESFIPSQVGLGDLQIDLQQYDSKESEEEYEQQPQNDPDHLWHELDPRLGQDIELTTNEPTSTLTFAELVEAFRTVEWDLTQPVR